MSLLLRRAKAADLDGIMALERSVFADDAWPERAMRAELASVHGHYLVVVDDGAPDAVLGYAGLLAGRGSGEGDIQTIAVAPEQRGRGIGRALMHALTAEARARGAERLFLEVRADNPVARGLYDSLGFVEIGVRPNYYRDGVDAVAMRLDVPPAQAAPAAGASVASTGDGPDAAASPEPDDTPEEAR